MTSGNPKNTLNRQIPVCKITEKAVCRSVFFTIWYCILSAELSKKALLQTVTKWINPTSTS